MSYEGLAADMGFFGYSQAGAGEPSALDCHILISDALADNWALLDKFEGDGFKRILARCEPAHSQAGVGYI